MVLLAIQPQAGEAEVEGPSILAHKEPHRLEVTVAHLITLL